MMDLRKLRDILILRRPADFGGNDMGIIHHGSAKMVNGAWEGFSLIQSPPCV